MFPPVRFSEAATQFARSANAKSMLWPVWPAWPPIILNRPISLLTFPHSSNTSTSPPILPLTPSVCLPSCPPLISPPPDKVTKASKERTVNADHLDCCHRLKRRRAPLSGRLELRVVTFPAAPAEAAHSKLLPTCLPSSSTPVFLHPASPGTHSHLLCICTLPSRSYEEQKDHVLSELTTGGAQT